MALKPRGDPPSILASLGIYSYLSRPTEEIAAQKHHNEWDGINMESNGQTIICSILDSHEHDAANKAIPCIMTHVIYSMCSVSVALLRNQVAIYLP